MARTRYFGRCMDPSIQSKKPTVLGLGEARPADDSWCSGAAALRRRQQRQPMGEGDLAAGPPSRRHLTLSAPGWLPALCCCAPGALLFSMVAVVLVTFCFYPTAFYVVTALLTAFTITYSSNLSLSCAFGAYRMRKAAARDWHAELQRLQKECSGGESEVMHIVILPNYKEDEEMLMHTLEHLGRAPLARDSMYVVLAMEEREGAAGQDKAQRLMTKSKHLFAGIMASFHPRGLAGEIAGKSSNTQWAYRQMLQQFKPEISRLDASRVFLTVGDADTLWHPQFFSAMSCQALEMPEAERRWAFWQPPVLLMRNLFSVPGVTRVGSYAATLFELAGLANQSLSTHFCFSAYSLTLALATNPRVTGWDGDVIAEDHHMFCKCYFASLWEQVERADSDADARGSPAKKALASQVKLCPVYLPAISYLVESDEGSLASMHARFQQARRHMQGVAEMSYVLLHYVELCMAVGACRLPWRVHAGVLSIVGKMASMHIINAVQGFATLATILALLPGAFAWLQTGGLGEVFAAAAANGILSTLCAQNFGGLRWALAAIFGPIPPLSILMTATIFVVVRDVLEGRLTQGCEDIQGAVGAGGPKSSGMSWWQKLKLLLMIQVDFLGNGHFCLLAFSFVPEIMAVWSLMRNGSKFEYIVAAKPK